MADDISKIGRKKSSERIPDEEIELQELKPIKKSKDTKTSESISHIPLTRISKEQKPLLNGNEPLIAPPLDFTISEVKDIHSNLEKKLTEPNSYEEILERLESHEGKIRINKATEDINKILQSKLSFESKTMQIQMILLETMNFSLDIGGEYEKTLSVDKARHKKEEFDLLVKQQEKEREAAKASWISVAFGFFGDVVNLIFAAIAVVATTIAAAPTAGVTTPMIAGAIAWLSGAVLGLAARSLETARATGVLPSDKAWVGTLFAWTGIILSIGGMGVGSASAALKVGQQAPQMFINLIKKLEVATQFLRVGGETASSITGAYFKYKIEGLRAEKTEKEKIQNELEYMHNYIIQMIQNILKSQEDLASKISSGIAQSSLSAKSVLGNLPTSHI